MSAASAAPTRGPSDAAQPLDGTSVVPPLPAREQRLLSLDVFRGLTVAGMLLVNDPGTWSAIYPPLEHAPWHGWTPTDLIFPFFLFIVGITTQLSLGARRARGDDDRALVHQIIRRGALIFLVGLLINGFPFFTWGSVDGIVDPSFAQRVVDRLLHWRIMGVLQRIGLAYLIAALLTLRTTLRTQIVMLVAILMGYWFALTLLPVPGTGTIGATLLHSPEHTLAAWLDRLLLDWGRFGNHLWVNSRTWDPEGPFSTIPAVGTVILGSIAGRWIGTKRPLSERLSALFGAGCLAMVVGVMWGWSFPINKSLWTSSYVLFSAGMASVTLATCMWLVDELRIRGWTKFFVVYGTNPLIAFAGSGVMARCIYSIFTVRQDGASVPLQRWIFDSFYGSWLAPRDASLLFAITFVLFWYGILWMLHRRKLFIKL